MFHRFGLRENPKCIFCGAKINFSDAMDICKNHYKRFYAIPKLLRWLLPKFIIKQIVLKGG